MFPALLTLLNQEDGDGKLEEEMRRETVGIREEVDDDDDDDDGVVSLGGEPALVDGVLTRSQDAAGATVAAEISDSSSEESEDHDEARDKESGNRSRLGSQSADALVDMENEGLPEMVSNLRGGGGPSRGDFLSIPGFSSHASVSSVQVFSQEQDRIEMRGNGGHNEDMVVR